jgi:sortase A
MKIRMPARRALRWVEFILAISGAMALCYCLCTLAGGWIYQAWQGHLFNVALPRERPESAPVQPSAPDRRPAPKPGAIVGRIEIPRLSLSNMIVEGVAEPELRLGLGHIPGTALPGERGNVAIAGHRDTFFRPLRNICLNDSIQLVTLDGTYGYRVVSTRIVDPADVQVLNPTRRDTLTLVTCYPFYFVGSAPKRFIVRAVRSTA